MKCELSDETVETLRSPLAKLALFSVGAAALVLFFQLLLRI
jgi:hypothetical protein